MMQQEAALLARGWEAGRRGREAARSAFVAAAGAAVVGFAFVLQASGAATVWGSYAFSFALLGLFAPARLLEAYIFLLALLHRDFTYTSMKLYGADIYISEWVLALLLAAAVPKMRQVIRDYPLAAGLLAVYLAVGGTLLWMGFGHWPLGAALRDFVLVYYALFIVAALAHTNGTGGVIRLFSACAAGAALNLAADFGNYLYGTFPVTAEQKNYSMRSSFYYCVTAGFLLPFVGTEKGWRRALSVAAGLVIYVVVFMYSYSKTAMAALLAVGALYMVIGPYRKNWRAWACAAFLFTLPLFFTPAAKIFHLNDLIAYSASSDDSRAFLTQTGWMDYAEYPYGIGFGTPIFGEHAVELIPDVDNFKALHNSYLTVFRRMGFEGGISFWLLVLGGVAGVVAALRKMEDEKRLREIRMGALLGFASTAMFARAHVALEGPFLGALFWTLTGCLFVLAKPVDERTIP